MSYIDTIKHEFVGFFLGLPIYHPLEVIEYEDCSMGDFACTPENFIIGGGGGEHPGLVLKHPENMVARYLSFRIDLLNEKLDKKTLEYWDYELLIYEKNNSKFFNFCGWELNNYKSFIEWCESETSPTPYSPEYFESIENWIILSFGEFILFSFPELIPTLINKFSELISYLKYSELNNILTIPKGFKSIYTESCINNNIKK